MPMPGDRILVCLTRTSDADEQACRQVLSPEELERAHAFKFEKDRLHHIVARAQVRCLISEVTGVPPRTLCLARSKEGKPVVSPGTPGQDLSFNISHSGGLVVTALGRGASLGIDLECRNRKSCLDIARRYFTPEETAQILAVPEPDRAGQFLRFWTLKEAWIKAVGRGLALGLDRISFDLTTPEQIRWVLTRDRVDGNWQFFQFFPVPGAVAALAVEARAPRRVDFFHGLPLKRRRPAEVRMLASSL